jgi:hypothetical protein
MRFREVRHHGRSIQQPFSQRTCFRQRRMHCLAEHFCRLDGSGHPLWVLVASTKSRPAPHDVTVPTNSPDLACELRRPPLTLPSCKLSQKLPEAVFFEFSKPCLDHRDGAFCFSRCQSSTSAFAAYRFSFNAGWALGPATAGFLAKYR